MAVNKGNITKKDIVEDISARTGLTQVNTKAILESFLDAVINAMAQGSNIEIRKFGRFKIKKRKERAARNPRTGESVVVGAGIKPVFEASRELTKLLNDGVPEVCPEAVSEDLQMHTDG